VLLIVDLDGVVYRGPNAVPGVPELLRERVAAGDVVVYATNNSSRHRSDYQAILERLGAPVSLERIVTSARATAVWLCEHRPGTERVMVLGGPGLRRELRDAGLHVLAPTPGGLARQPQAVAVGIDRGMTYWRLAIAADAIRAGALFVATNRDPVYPSENGLMPGAGAVVAALQVATGHEPIVIGKPEPGLFEAAAVLAGVPPADAVVIGDGLGTDIAAAKRFGARSVLMLTGVTTEAELAVAPADARPTLVARDGTELKGALERLNSPG
jgi:phosphoglycolate/pyridoxal phosphate phosphatase family enzyme